MIGKRNKENDVNPDRHLLTMITKSLKEREKRVAEEKNKTKKKEPLRNVDINKEISFNKKETEAIMENLMNRIVAKPNLIADDSLNYKIEKIFNNHMFQKMVENAEIFQDLSSTSFLSSNQNTQVILTINIILLLLIASSYLYFIVLF
jgi:hypothetical protein